MIGAGVLVRHRPQPTARLGPSVRPETPSTDTDTAYEKAQGPGGEASESRVLWSVKGGPKSSGLVAREDQKKRSRFDSRCCACIDKGYS
ncbi:hypothetical protein EVG20_g9062 [Dentipellis fragilis]|uniref:Uncharacterized protein n=1 Tax=Dentipellis fragilis TaxID=205917 RepID=A0A4Y9Y149_9AGAM|nr:hypothetical protein EVG20_g9062 [Dentipellis fragilis]